MEICGKLKVYIIKYYSMADSRPLETPSSSSEKVYTISSIDQLKALLKEKWWTDDKISGFFWKISGVNNPFKERVLTEAQLTNLAKKLDGLKTTSEQRMVLNQFARDTLIEDIGLDYTFDNAYDLSKAIEERGAIYPKNYLEQPNSSFIANFQSPKKLSKERFDTLITDLKAITGNTALDDANRWEIIRSAFMGIPVPLKISETGFTAKSDIPLLDEAGKPTVGITIEKGKKLDVVPNSEKTIALWTTTLTMVKIRQDGQEYWVAKNSISETQNQTTPATAPKTTLADTEKSIREEAEKIQDLSVTTIRLFLSTSDTIISTLDKLDARATTTLRWVVWALLGDKLSQKWYSLKLVTPTTIQVGVFDASKWATLESAKQLSVVLSGNPAALESLKYGILFRSSQFEKFVEANYDKEKKQLISNPSLDYKKYLQWVYGADASKYTEADRAVLSLPENVLKSIDMRKAIEGTALWVSLAEYMQKNPEKVAALAGTMPPPPAPDTPQPAWAVQWAANTAAGKVGEFAWEAASNIGWVAKWFTQALGEGFKQGWFIGWAIVALIGIIWGWKILNKEWNLWPLGKHSGWMGALVLLWGKTAYDMMEKYGLIDKGKEVAATGTKKVKEVATSANKPAPAPSSDSADAPPAGAAKPPEKVDVAKLSPSQVEASKSVQENTDIKKSLEGKTPAMAEYLNFLHKEISNLPMHKLINDSDTSIFSASPQIDATLQSKLWKLNPITLKKILRAYVWAPVLFTIPTDGSKSGKSEKEGFLKRLGEKWLNVELYTKDKTLGELTSALYAGEKPKEAVKLSPEAQKKILAYELIYDNQVKPKDNFTITFADTPDKDGDFKVTLVPKNPKDLNEKADKIDPIEIYFDKDGNLRSEEITISGCAVILWQKIPDSQACLLKQDANKIIITKK
jgi:hypothetical protein